MKLTSDWHIHSRNSCDSACMTVATLIERAGQLGIEDYGLTDHLHTPFNMPDLRASRGEFLASKPGPRFHFGVEVSCVSQWELDQIATGKHKDPVYGLRQGGPAGGPLAIGLTPQDIDELGIEYVVAGAHWQMYCPWDREPLIRDYHRQNMFLACHPLVDIVAHPWWWHQHWPTGENGGWKQVPEGVPPGEPWMADFSRIPSSMHDEFISAARQHGAAVEVNLQAMLFCPHYSELFQRQYLEYLARIQQAGVPLGIGSDCHDGQYNIDFARAAATMESAGLRLDRLWRLAARTGHGPRL